MEGLCQLKVAKSKMSNCVEVPRLGKEISQSMELSGNTDRQQDPTPQQALSCGPMAQQSESLSLDELAFGKRRGGSSMQNSVDIIECDHAHVGSALNRR